MELHNIDQQPLGSKGLHFSELFFKLIVLVLLFFPSLFFSAKTSSIVCAVEIPNNPITITVKTSGVSDTILIMLVIFYNTRKQYIKIISYYIMNNISKLPFH